MLDMPLRVGLGGSGPVSRGVEFQVNLTDGMEFAWSCAPDSVEEKLKNNPIDVFVEACGDVADAAECSLLAIENHAHVILTDARVDVAVGLTLQTEAHPHGIIVTSDSGTPHGALATMIQEAHIMGFDTMQAGQISPRCDTSRFLYEMAALANGFGFLPPSGGMTGPRIETLDKALTSFDFESYGDTPRIDFLRLPSPTEGLYLIVKPKVDLPEEQVAHLRNCQLGDGPYYLIHRPRPLGYFETPKAILGAAAGQPVLSPGYPTCQVYATLKQDLQMGTEPSEGHLEAHLSPNDENLIPLAVLQEGAKLKIDLPKGQPLTFQNTLLPEPE